MVNFTESRLDALAIHRIGSKQSDEGVTLSKTLFPLDLHDITDPLQTYFVGSFKWQDVQQFTHRTDIAQNEVYALAAQIFDTPTELLQHSVEIAKHLYEKSAHPKIKTGDFFVAYWYDVIYEDELCNAIGIFKAENRDVFLKTTSSDNGVDLLTEEGINIKTLDKGALILDTGREEGFRVFVVDKASRNSEAQYWCDEFLQIERVHDNAFHTASYLDMMVDFCEDIVSKDTNRKEQVDFLNKSLDFFNKKETIDWKEFDDEVLATYETEADDTVLNDEPRAFRDEFERYKSKFETRNAIEPQNGFTVSKPAIAKAKRRFKNLIKMDTEIELKIKPISEDADNPFVERGYDEERGMHFYKVYFNHES
jgi:hypothetical protein